MKPYSASYCHSATIVDPFVILIRARHKPNLLST